MGTKNEAGYKLEKVSYQVSVSGVRFIIEHRSRRLFDEWHVYNWCYGGDGSSKAMKILELNFRKGLTSQETLDHIISQLGGSNE